MTSTLDERIDHAETEGGAKCFLSDELKELPNYSKICDCAFHVRYWETVGDTMVMRIMCLRCGGMMFE